MAFADSIEALARNRAARTATVCGIRLRPSMVASRFGVPVEDDPELIATVSSLPLETPLGVSFHARREDFKGASWRDVAADVLERARVLERDSGRKITVFDVGGGWTPDEFHGNFAPDMRWLVDRVAATLPACRTLVAEPGQALCTPTEAIMTTIVEVRERRGRREAILDVGYSDWPQMQAYSHRMFAWREESWRALGRGPDQLGGRTCLEYDAVHGVRLPLDVAAGDRLLIADTGSYDHAMAFDFARGRSDGTTPYD